MFTQQEIIEKFNIDNSHGFQTWFMGTNEFDIWQNIIIVIKQQVGNPNVGHSIVNASTIDLNEVDANRYEFKIGDFNILSSKISKKGPFNFLAQSTLNQYIDFGIALRFINEEKSNKNVFRYKLYPNFINFITTIETKNLDDVFLEKIYTLLQTYIYSNNQNVRSILCSVSWAILLANSIQNNDGLQELITNKIIELKKKDNKDNGITQFDGTYSSLATRLIKKFGIDNLLKIIENNSKTLSNISLDIPRVKSDELTRLIMNYRSQLRRNIISSRVHNAYWYTDFNSPIVERHIGDLEACHIKEVNQIQNELRRKDLDNRGKMVLFEQLNDANNGILLNRDAHYLFDDRLFEIDPRNGQIIIENNEISKKRVCQAFGVGLDQSESLFLKDNVLSEEMKQYLRSRI